MVWELLYGSLAPLPSREDRHEAYSPYPPGSSCMKPNLPQGWATLGLCLTPSSVNGPHWPCLGSHTPSVVLPPPLSLQSLLLNIGWGGEV